MKRLALSAAFLLITFASLFSHVNKGDSLYMNTFTPADYITP
ncbi:MAG: hypothetical protein PHP30_00935 [Bacteroidales bacterium]|nr:hypothetical protein [Bacteroidales bacterium]MDD3988651.1 hypothetical protein [Bacteroidales bacterium]MDD4638333.1 hypothetical protein [Bacteroidales bacterium]